MEKDNKPKEIGNEYDLSINNIDDKINPMEFARDNIMDEPMFGEDDFDLSSVMEDDFFRKFAQMNQRPTDYNRNNVGFINYNFDYTSFENLSDKELVRRFFCKPFYQTLIIEKMDLIQELVNRLTKDMGLKSAIEVTFMDNPEHPVTLDDKTINVDMKTLNMPMLLYVQLVGLVEQQRQIEYAIDYPESPIAIQLKNNVIDGLITSDEYDHSKIVQKQGTGLTYFGKPLSTDLKFEFIDPQLIISNRETQKSQSNDYYIKRFQPTEREISKAMEIAMRKIENQLNEDNIFDDVERGSLFCLQVALGDYMQDRKEYMQRVEFPFLEDQIDAFLLNTEELPNQLAMFDTPVLKTDIKLASMKAYAEQNGWEFVDPREHREYNHSPEDFMNMNDDDIIRCFYPNNWSELALEEKKMLLQELCDREAYDLGLTRSYEVVFKETKEGDAYYNPIDKNICFNTTSLLEGNPLFLYGLIPHELIHAKQDEIRDGLIQAKSSEEYSFLQNSSFTTKDITTPEQYHGSSVTQIDNKNLKYKMNYFRPLYIEVNETTKPKTDEAFALYKLQAVEYEAYKHQEDKEIELKQQMIEDGVLDEQAQMMFTQLEAGNTTYMKNILQNTLGCQDPVEAIKQFQMYNAGVIDEYDAQTEECDFAMRYNLIATSTYMQYHIYPNDPRDTIGTIEQNQIFAKFEASSNPTLLYDVSLTDEEREIIMELLRQPDNVEESYEDIRQDNNSGGLNATNPNTDDMEW